MLTKLNKTISIALAFALVTACAKNDDGDVNDLSTKIVVEGYVFANEPLEGIHISRVSSSGNAKLIPVTNADVEIEQNGIRVQLTDSTGNSGIYTPETSANYYSVDTSKIKLHVLADKKSYISQAVFLPRITDLAITNSQINIIAGNSTQTVASLSWSPVPNAAGYCIFMRNLSENVLPIIDAKMESSAFHRILYSTSIDLKSTDFTNTGTYDLYVTAINQEYANIYESTDANYLINGTSNIENGWGIFTAFNGMAVSVSVQ